MGSGGGCGADVVVKLQLAEWRRGFYRIGMSGLVLKRTAPEADKVFLLQTVLFQQFLYFADSQPRLDSLP